MEFGERLKELRAERNLHQEDVGAVVGYGKSTVSQWESGERVPAHLVLQKLADFFDVTLDYLVGRSDERQLNPILPIWLSKLPPDMRAFLEEESQRNWPFLRLARGVQMQDLGEEEVRAIVSTWMDAKKRYAEEKGREGK